MRTPYHLNRDPVPARVVAIAAARPAGRPLDIQLLFFLVGAWTVSLALLWLR